MVEYLNESQKKKKKLTFVNNEFIVYNSYINIKFIYIYI